MRERLLVHASPEQPLVLRLPAAAARLTRRAWLSILGFVGALGEFPDAIAGENPITVELGARTGIGLPFGRVDAPRTLGGGSASDPLDQTVGGTVPIWFDLGLRLAPRWYVGLFASAAPGWLGPALRNDCKANGVDCVVFDLRAGIDLQYHLRPEETWDPWLGAGLGYELLAVNVAEGGSSPSSWLAISGWELANVQAGVDYRLAMGLAVGPFVSLALAEYSSAHEPGASSSSFDGVVAVHGWVVFGVRSTWDIGGPPPSTR
jgi:hypothetical protein